MANIVVTGGELIQTVESFKELALMLNTLKFIVVTEKLRVGFGNNENENYTYKEVLIMIDKIITIR